jgi:O-antigen/teichoic acid export membrane protein
MVAKIAQVGSRLVTIPMVIAHLGLGGYGIWSIIMSMAAYMRFGSAGIKSAFQKYVAEATGNGDFERASKLLSTGAAGMLLLSAAAIPVALLSRTLAKAAGVPPEFIAAAAKSISALAIIMILSNMGAAYEGIVMGGHRIDLARNFSAAFSVAEAIAIIILLHLGHGLFAMALVIALSEVGFVFCCYLSSKSILPQIRVSRRFVTKSVVRELIRFAGSYQLVNILEVLYVSILPVTVLRVFGANASGVYAISTRLVQSALMLWEAFLLPILSGGAMIYALGSKEEMRRLIAKSFKLTLGICLFPLVFIGLFGPTMIFAWTGRSDPLLPAALWLVVIGGFLSAFSALSLVLYRSSGNAILDNIRQGLRIVVLLSVVAFARKLNFNEILTGLAVAEFVGMVFMLFAISKTFHAFHPKDLLPDALRLSAATACVLVAGALAEHLSIQLSLSARLLAILDLSKVSLGCIVALWPALLVTRSLTEAEKQALFHIIVPQALRPKHFVESAT